MNVNLTADFPITEEACQAETGKTITEWIAALEVQGEISRKRREAISWLYDGVGRGKDVWWPTTIWVEKERRGGVVQKDGRAEGYTICSTKTIAAPVEAVYAAWIGEGPAKWWGEEPTAAEDASISDAKGNQATAIRVRENKDLRYKWQTAGEGDITVFDVTFVDKGKGKTLVTLTHQRLQTREEADGLRRAWGEAFDRLKKVLE